MDNLGSLNAFVQAAEVRSFTAAGRNLGVSSSAVGKAVARLEERLGVRLFHRSTRTMTLTPEGTLFLERCRKIFCEIEAAEQELSRSQEAPRGRLRISLPLVGMLMMPTLSAFMRAYPEVEVDLDFTDRLVDVIEEGFDAVVRTGETSDSRLMTRTLGVFSQRLVASPDYLHRRGTPSHPNDLRDHACLHHKFPSTGRLEPWPLRSGRSVIDLDLPVTSASSSLEPLIHMAESGLGIASLPDFTVRRQIEDGRLVALLQDFLRHSGTFRVVWPSSRHLSPKIRVFVAFLVDHLFASGRVPTEEHPVSAIDSVHSRSASSGSTA